MIVGNAKSAWLEVKIGTTQGTVLGLLLFLIFINDLPDTCNPNNTAAIKLLADDTKTFQEIRSDPTTHEEDRAALQQRINAMAEWAVTNDMVYHQDKVKRMHVGQQNPELPYYLNGQEIPKT